METYKLGEMEEKFAEMIWQHAPVRSGDLAKLCEESFSWKRTTACTMLKRLCERGLFANENGLVTARMSREDFKGARGELFLKENFPPVRLRHRRCHNLSTDIRKTRAYALKRLLRSRVLLIWWVGC